MPIPAGFPGSKGMKISDLIPNKDVLLTRAFWNAQNRFIGGCEPEKAVDISATANYPNTPKEMQLAPAVTNQTNQRQNGNGSQSTQKTMQPKKVPALQNLTQPCGRVISDQSELANDLRSAAPEINFDYALIQRLNRIDLTTRLISFNLGKVVLQHDASSDLELEPGDIVTIFSQRDVNVPQEKRTKFARVEGEVGAPGVYKIEPRDTLRTLIRRAGGVTPDAYLFATELTRESAKVEQQRAIDQRTAALSPQNDAQRRLLAQLRYTTATGRIVLQMRPSDTTIDDFPDIVLEDGDRIVIPYQEKTVNVLGAIFNQSGYLYHSGMHVQDYLKMAGNGIPGADMKHLLVLRADGSVLGRPGGSAGFWHGNLQDVRVLPGDTIVIPTKVSSGLFLQSLKDWTQIAGQLAITAASLAVATGH